MQKKLKGSNDTMHQQCCATVMSTYDWPVTNLL